MPRPVSPHRSATLPRELRRLLGALLLAAVAAIPAVAQEQPADPPPAAEPAAEGVPAGATPAAPPNVPPVDAGELPPEEEPPTAVPTDEGQPKPAGPALPPGFSPPPAAPAPVMVLRKPSMTDAEIKTEEGDLRKLQVTSIIRSGELNAQARDVLARFARLQFARMAAVDVTSPTERVKISDIGRETSLLLRNAATTQGNAQREREFREAFFAEIVKAASGVLDNNFYVRMQAATILSQLNSREAPISGPKQPPISYVPALVPLLDILANAEQPEPIKVMAAVGVGRIAENAESIPVELRYRAGDVLTKEIARQDAHPWFQMRLAEALASIELDFDKNRRPIVLEALLAVVSDSKRDCLARSAAARALGRAPAPAGVWNDKVVATAVVQAAREMAASYNRLPSRVEWFSCFENLYLTFLPGTGEDLNRLPTSALLRKGTLTGQMEAAHGMIRPIVEHVLNQPLDPKQPHAPIPVELLRPLDEFLKPAATP